MSDAPLRRWRDACLLKIVVDRFADADVAAAVADADTEVVDAAVKDSASCRPIAAPEPEDDAWELVVFPEEAVVNGPDAEVAVFPRSDADAAAADAEYVRFPRFDAAAAAAETVMVRFVETWREYLRQQPLFDWWACASVSGLSCCPRTDRNAAVAAGETVA